jgi:hypothetical protein
VEQPICGCAGFEAEKGENVDARVAVFSDFLDMLFGVINNG